MVRSGNRYYRPMQDFFNSKVNDVNDGCWEWPGCIGPKGYGTIRVNYKMWNVHRLAYERRFGPVPKGLELDHLCRHRWCWNPLHLEAVPHQVNVDRGNKNGHYLKSHCSRGHDFSEHGYECTDRQGRTYRRCGVCVWENNQRRKVKV